MWLGENIVKYLQTIHFTIKWLTKCKLQEGYTKIDLIFASATVGDNRSSRQSSAEKSNGGWGWADKKAWESQGKWVWAMKFRTEVGDIVIHN